MPKKTQKPYSIKVKLNKSADPCLEYKPSGDVTIHRKYQDGTFQWMTNDGILKIDFAANPFDNCTPPFTSSQVGQWIPSTPAHVSDAARETSFKYSVTLTESNGETCIDDPRIIIQDDQYDVIETVLKVVIVSVGIGLVLWGLRSVWKEKYS